MMRLFWLALIASSATAHAQPLVEPQDATPPRTESARAADAIVADRTRIVDDVIHALNAAQTRAIEEIADKSGEAGQAKIRQLESGVRFGQFPTADPSTLRAVGDVVSVKGVDARRKLSDDSVYATTVERFEPVDPSKKSGPVRSKGPIAFFVLRGVSTQELLCRSELGLRMRTTLLHGDYRVSEILTDPDEIAKIVEEPVSRRLKALAVLEPIDDDVLEEAKKLFRERAESASVEP